MIASITLLADVFHETARALAKGGRQRLRVAAACLLENEEDPSPLFPVTGDLDCALISLSIGDQTDALRLLVCRGPSATDVPSSTMIAELMAKGIAMNVTGWANATVGITVLPGPQGGWPAVLATAAEGIRAPAPGVGVVVAELGADDARYQVLAGLLGDQQAGLSSWAPTAAGTGA